MSHELLVQATFKVVVGGDKSGFDEADFRRHVSAQYGAHDVQVRTYVVLAAKSDGLVPYA